jgi:hypothetical protein
MSNKKGNQTKVAFFYCLIVILVILGRLELVSYFSFLNVSRMLQALLKIACKSSIATRS